MGRKAKYNKQQKVQACEDYLSGTKSASQIAKELEMGKRGCALIASWCRFSNNLLRKNSSYML